MYSDPTGHIRYSLADAFAIIDKYLRLIDEIRQKLDAEAERFAQEVKENAKNLADAAGNLVVAMAKKDIAISNSTKAAIATGFQATAFIVIGVGINVFAPGLGSPFLNAGISMATTMIFDFAEDGVFNKSTMVYKVAAVTGFISGTLSMFGNGLNGVENIVIEGISETIADAAGQYISTGKVDAGQSIAAGITAGIFTGLLQKFTDFLGEAFGSNISDQAESIYGGKNANTFDLSDETGYFDPNFRNANAIDLSDESGYIEFGGNRSNVINEGAGNTVGIVPNSLLQGSANTRVYLGIKDGATDYVGITKDIAKRQAQHGVRFDFLREITTEPVTRRQARAIEQAMKANPSFSNKINSISPNRDWFNDAVNWGNNRLNSNGYLP
jgi:predicted GIY-YIG superfamily endonuclease